jgi:DNA polymerase lambda
VDILITHPDGHSHAGLFQQLISRLHEIGFLTDDLVSVEHNGDQKKYLGVCKLPGDNTKHRRLDIIIVPYTEFACALMYFTGSTHFNRSMRNLARRLNMSLNEHELCAGVVRRNGEKVSRGTPLLTPTEESVFNHLGLTYRPPDERDH